MSRLDSALNRLAERGDPIGSDLLLERLESQLTGQTTTVVVGLETRRRSMEDTTTLTPETSGRTRMRRLLPALAAATAVIVALVAVAMFFNGGPETDVANEAVADVEASEWCRIGFEYGTAFAREEYFINIGLEDEWIASAPPEIAPATRDLIETLSGGPSTWTGPDQWAEPVGEIKAFRELHCDPAEMPGF